MFIKEKEDCAETQRRQRQKRHKGERDKEDTKEKETDKGGEERDWLGSEEVLKP